MNVPRALLLVLLVLLAAGGLFDRCAAEDLDAAKQQFLTSCGTCHTVEQGTPPRQGPNLATVYGRRVASLPDFAYSDALRRGDWIWTEATLDPWIRSCDNCGLGLYEGR